MYACSPLMFDAPRPSATFGIASFPVATMLPESSNVAVAILLRSLTYRNSYLGFRARNVKERVAFVRKKRMS